MKIIFIIIITLVTSMISISIKACGDSLHLVGKGVSYRVYTAPLPGSVLVYGQGEGTKALAKALARSGHGVFLATNKEILDTELQKGGYDVIIAAYSEHKTIESSTNKTNKSAATFIPVTLNDKEELLARQSYDRVMKAEQDEVKHFLQAIHKTLKSRT